MKTQDKIEVLTHPHGASQNSGISPLSCEEWRTLESLANAAHEAISALSTALLIASGDAKDPAKASLLKEYERAHSCVDSILPGYFYHPQTEWFGGDKECFREPHIASVLPRRTVL